LDRYRQANLRLWDELAALHPETEFYRVEEFKRGRETLRPFEIEELGDVRGRTLLHLQCHFGLDTMSWARRGASVTGADFSAVAIEIARALAGELGIEARFVQSELYELPKHLDGRFDVVYTSLGVLRWLPDLEGWARIIDHFLAPGGTFYIAEFHPITQVFDGTEGVADPLIRYSYFPRREPLERPVAGSYADPMARLRADRAFEWLHSLGEIVSTVAERSLRIEFLHELPYSPERWAAFMERREDGNWWLPEHASGELPMIFTLRAAKPA
jgi:2-polyprenyl-3-methyl-5-hydroxy-6-metoxy-1,4-benzoquinol methylase